MSWSVVDRYVRKITRNTGNARQINVPRSIQNIIAGNDVQWVILKDCTGNRIIALCGIDDFNNLMDVIGE